MHGQGPRPINLTWSMWLLTAKPGTGGALKISCRNAWMCRSLQRNESAFNSGIFHYILENKHFQSKLKMNNFLPTCSSATECVKCMGKRKWLEKKLTPAQGEAKWFVFITETHRKEMQNTKQPKANGEEDFLRVNVCFYPSVLRSARIYVNTTNIAVPKYSMPDNL